MKNEFQMKETNISSYLQALFAIFTSKWRIGKKNFESFSVVLFTF
jgi:hypothetical protein